MSSTGRGPRLGGPDDFFTTPAWAVHRLLEAWTPPAGLAVEPGAGDGAIIKAAKAFSDKEETRTWHAIECRATARVDLEGVADQVSIADFLNLEERVETEVRAVISNPPFKDAEAFIRQAAALYPDAQRAFLVRLGFLASEGRAQLWKDLGTPSVYVLPNRPSFTPDGKTDSADYCWIVFEDDEEGSPGELRVLNTTPRELRKGKR